MHTVLCKLPWLPCAPPLPAYPCPLGERCVQGSPFVLTQGLALATSVARITRGEAVVLRFTYGDAETSLTLSQEHLDGTRALHGELSPKGTTRPSAKRKSRAAKKQRKSKKGSKAGTWGW